MITDGALPSRALWHRLLGGSRGAVSENGCLCQREEGHGGDSRRRSVLMFPTLLGKRVLEGVLELGIECRLVQELRRRQRRERRTERRPLSRRNARHDRAEQRLV